MQIYLAARYSRRLELCDYKVALEDDGHVITSTWLNGSHQIDDHGTPIGDAGEALVESGDDASAEALRRRFAIEDLADVRRSDFIVAFTEKPRSEHSRGGRHVELGAAIAWGMPIVIIGPRENLFCWLPQIQHYPTFGTFRAGLVATMNARKGKGF